MNPLDWIKLFATFAEVAPDVVEAFAAKHPELRAPPRRDAQSELWDDFQDKLADKFPADEGGGE